MTIPMHPMSSGEKNFWTIVFLLFFVSCLIVAWYVFVPEPEREMPAPPTKTEEKEFRQRLRYHGLDKQVTVIFYDSSRPYFIRAGKRCAF